MNDVLFLIAYHFIFFCSWYRNPFKLCTSEIASLWFPYLRYAKGRILFKDPIYFPYPASMPVLSSFYPPQLLIGFICKFFSLDTAFRIFSYSIFLHYLAASLIAYKVMGLFGALTLTYAGYCIKPQTPSFVYTMCWIPGMFLPGFWGAFSLGMAILGGYWPILVYVLPCLIFNPSASIGLIVGLPQIVPFMWYWKKSVRDGEKTDSVFGRVPWYRFKDLFWPSRSVSMVNGVHYPEMAMYMGIAVLFIWKASLWWFPAVYSILVLCNFLSPIQRIPSRALYLLTLSLSFLSSGTSLALELVILQACLLLRNSSLYPSFPFSQWWNKPSKMFKTLPLLNEWPYFTGYLQETKIDTYRGSFRLKGESAYEHS